MDGRACQTLSFTFHTHMPQELMTRIIQGDMRAHSHALDHCAMGFARGDRVIEIPPMGASPQVHSMLRQPPEVDISARHKEERRSATRRAFTQGVLLGSLLWIVASWLTTGGPV